MAPFSPAPSFSPAPRPAELPLGTVFWDMENCTLNVSVKGYEAVRRIKDLAKARHISLTNIVAISNLDRLPAGTKLELEESGVVMQNVSSGKPSASDIAILGELLKLCYHYKPPHAIILISGDRDFSKVLNFLDWAHYRVILIHPPAVSPILLHAVGEHLLWGDLLAGKFSKEFSSSPFLAQTPARLTTPLPDPPSTPSPTIRGFTDKGLHKLETDDDLISEGNSQDVTEPAPKADRPLPPERFLLLLRELRKLCTSTKSPFIRTSLLQNAVQRCGMDMKECLAAASSLQLIRHDPRADSVCLTEMGGLFLGKYKGRRIAEIAGCVVPVLETVDPAFWPLMRRVVDNYLLTNGKEVPLKKLASQMELDASSLGYSSAYDYIEAARVAGLIEVDANLPILNRNTSSTPWSESAVVGLTEDHEALMRDRGVPEKWQELVKVLVLCQTTAQNVPVGSIERMLKNQFASWKHGYSSVQAMLDDAEAIGILSVDETQGTVSLELGDPAVAAGFGIALEELKKQALLQAKAPSGKAASRAARKARKKLQQAGLTLPTSAPSPQPAESVSAIASDGKETIKSGTIESVPIEASSVASLVNGENATETNAMEPKAAEPGPIVGAGTGIATEPAAEAGTRDIEQLEPPPLMPPLEPAVDLLTAAFEGSNQPVAAKEGSASNGEVREERSWLGSVGHFLFG